MDARYITKSELAKVNGVSNPYITKLFKKGVFDRCMDGKKIIRDCALKAYIDNKDPTRDNQRAVNRKPKSIGTVEIEKETRKNIKDSDLYNQDNLEELEDLVLTATSGNQKVQIIKDFWTGKINQQKYLEGQKFLIPKEQIIKDVQRILKAFRDKALALPTKISSDLVGLTEKREIATVVESYMYELLEDLSNLEDIE